MKASIKAVDFRSVKVTLPAGHPLNQTNQVSEIVYMFFSIPGNVYGCRMIEDEEGGEKKSHIFTAHQNLRLKQSGPILRYEPKTETDTFKDFIRAEYRKAYRAVHGK